MIHLLAATTCILKDSPVGSHPDLRFSRLLASDLTLLTAAPTGLTAADSRSLLLIKAHARSRLLSIYLGPPILPLYGQATKWPKSSIPDHQLEGWLYYGLDQQETFQTGGVCLP